jgi:hypothetical protein
MRRRYAGSYGGVLREEFLRTDVGARILCLFAIVYRLAGSVNRVYGKNDKQQWHLLNY